MQPLIAVPLKPFSAAKARLADRLEPSSRSRLMESVAGKVVRAALDTGAATAVVTGDETVADWARSNGAEVITERPGEGLNGAAAIAADRAVEEGRVWCVVHGDLPLLRPAHLQAALEAAVAGRAAIAPSRNGGTSLLAARCNITFRYGPGSFHRHLAALAGSGPRVLVSVGLALDLDTVDDLGTAARLAGGSWLAGFLG